MATAFIAGSNVLAHDPFRGGEPHAVETTYGAAVVHRGDGWVVVLRHGERGTVAPHRINHRANIDAVRRLGCTRVVSLCSVGALRRTIPRGAFLVPDDFINLAPVLTFYDEDPPYATPTLGESLRAELRDALDSLDERYIDAGVYYQTVGPRLETRAEVRMISQFADVVGMTFGHEATLCAEAELEVAALCSVDNVAHGIAAEPLRAADILREKEVRSGRVAAVAGRLLARRKKTTSAKR